MRSILFLFLLFTVPMWSQQTSPQASAAQNAAHCLYNINEALVDCAGWILPHLHRFSVNLRARRGLVTRTAIGSVPAPLCQSSTLIKVPASQ